MDTISNNLNDPSWWFTGLFFAFIAYILPTVFQRIKFIPVVANGLKRKFKLKRLRQVKNIRFDETKIIIEAVKSSAWMIVFILAAFILFYSFLTEPILLKDKNSGWILIIFSMPLYILEIVYLTQEAFHKDVIESRDKLRITKQLSQSQSADGL